MSVDVIVIGAGVEGLAAAAMLGRAGRKVVVVDHRDAVGGLLASEEFHPGFRTGGMLHDASGLRPWLIDALGLKGRGLVLRDPPPVFAPQKGGDGKGLLLHKAPSRSRGELQALGPDDVMGYTELRRFLETLRPLVDNIVDAAPPDISSEAPLWPLAKPAVALRRLGKREMLELLRVGPACLDDFLSELLTSPLLRAALMPPALLGTWMGPRSPSSAATFLLNACSTGKEPAVGPSGLIEPLVAACRAAGVEFRSGTRVTGVRVVQGVVQGVDLEDGTRIEAAAVLSTAPARKTLLELVEPLDLPTTAEEEASKIRCRGSLARVFLAVKGKLEFDCRPGQAFERAFIAEHPLDLERGFDHVKHRRMPTDPPLDVRVPSLADASLAPEGHCVVSLLLHCAPFQLDEGWSDETREQLGNAAVASLERYASGISGRVVGRKVFSPADLADEYGLDGGHVWGGELAVDTLWVMRPGTKLAHYKTPIEGLWLGSASMHPGAGLLGSSGALAAKALLRG